MRCITFYSYKGGVGRTLALVNVAANLAIRGKKVLVVDFDLEAPGITTLDICSSASGKQGVVDYIHKYLLEGIAPNAADYIHACNFMPPSTKTCENLHVMPAGDQSASYGTSFAKIDWRELYEEREGFLLIEDLREQWINLGYDYVLIDSRTGLTDVSGICTRQLPDGIVTIFFPNEQNLSGLKEMVQSVRASSARPKSPELLFVASRLPRLDDEDGILERWLERFQKELGYSSQQFCSLDQYDSLALLDQDVFVMSRPKTRLSKQYYKLSSLVSQLNHNDAQGALGYIKSVQRLYSSKINDLSPLMDPSNPFGFNNHADHLQSIQDIHQNDCVIQRYLAEHYYNLKDFTRLEVVLRYGISAGTVSNVDAEPSTDTLPRLYQLQMKMSAETGETELASSSAITLLKSVGASERMVVEALMVLVTADPTALPPVNAIKYLQNGKIEDFISLMNKFGISSRESDYNCQIALYAYERFGSDMLNAHQSVIELALIAGGEFDKALALLGSSYQPAALSEIAVQDAFNRAMALWGRDRAPSIPLFETLLDMTINNLDEYGKSANYQQCIGLIYAVLGNAGACHSHIVLARSLMAEGSGRREVSCWSFVEEPTDDFEKHCAEIENLARGENVIPLFMSKPLIGRTIN